MHSQDGDLAKCNGYRRTFHHSFLHLAVFANVFCQRDVVALYVGRDRLCQDVSLACPFQLIFSQLVYAVAADLQQEPSNPNRVFVVQQIN